MLKMPRFLAKMAQDLAKKTTCAFISCPRKLFRGLIKVIMLTCVIDHQTGENYILNKTKLTPHLKARKHTLFLDIMAV